jgi:hypothetical protein
LSCITNKRKKMSKRRPFLLYHWSPTKNRKSILHDGLCVGKLSRTSTLSGDHYRPKYICFSRSPSAAWALSAMQEPNSLQSWDLWMTWSNTKPYKTLTCDSSQLTLTEYRIFERIPKSMVWYVGTRELIPHKTIRKSI